MYIICKTCSRNLKPHKDEAMAASCLGIWTGEDEALGRSGTEVGATETSPCPTAGTGLWSSSREGRSVGAQLMPCPLGYVFMGLPSNKGICLTQPEPFAVSGQLLEMFGAVSFALKGFLLVGQMLDVEATALLSHRCAAWGQTV